MSRNNMLFIKSIDGLVLSYNTNDLKDNIYVSGTIFDKIFFGDFNRKKEIILHYSNQIVSYLISYIRSGIIYLPNRLGLINILHEPNESNSEYYELSCMLDYIAGNNKYLSVISDIFKQGAMDLLGRKITMKNSAFISTKDLFYLLPYSTKQSNQLSIDLINQIIKINKDNNETNKINNIHNIKNLILSKLSNRKIHYFDCLEYHIEKTNPISILPPMDPISREEYINFIARKYAYQLNK
ncbi:hypothetical protein QKC54_gp0136 [Megavirus baoshan]|uniref:DUF5866 domain-containing protein n=1 Tax=Megavirus baoshan TaxID=2496520 RepID=A0A3S8UY93_9VIRU|nr:hypothetical protein QKC54_gp0136 [Megavirus baoshan]AZL89780.1 hypothetical protein Mb0936 [Megavirus baoshan]